ncbi:VRR-NUC domain-containing protein [Paenibacillus larvae subsp. larvae DSM 25719]|nr:VRR-NUC domain-containing protein [Paenibacillus larvae subsp. larvae DSM 25719]
MKEAQFQKKVTNFLNAQPDIWYVKVWGGGYQRAGIPDILCCAKGHFIAIELKSETGRTSKLQDYNLNRISESGGMTIVLRPSEFEAFKRFIREVTGKRGCRTDGEDPCCNCEYCR